MLSWHCDTELTPGSSTLSCRLLDEPLPSGQTVRWCLGCCCGCECSDSVLEITSMRPDRAGLFSCSMLSWMVESSLLSASRSEEICCRSDGATQREVKSLNIALQSSKSLHYEMKLKLSLSFKVCAFYLVQIVCFWQQICMSVVPWDAASYLEFCLWFCLWWVCSAGTDLDCAAAGWSSEQVDEASLSHLCLSLPSAEPQGWRPHQQHCIAL